MKKQILATIALGFGLIFGTSVAHADFCDLDCIYIASSGQLSFHNDTETGDANCACIDHCVGWGVNVSIGKIIDCYRLEIEGAFRCNDNDDYHPQGGSTVNDSGEIQNYSIMFNGFYDIQLADCISMYLGAGIGIGFVELDLHNSVIGGVSDHDTVFAWQLKGGFAYDINECWAVTLGYSFYATTCPSLQTLPNDSSRDLDCFPCSNNIDLGLRFRF